MTEFKTIEVDIDVEIQRILLSTYVQRHFSAPSVDLFNEKIVEYLEDQNLDTVFKAAGEAMLNEGLIEAIMEKIERSQQEQIEEDHGEDTTKTEE